MSDREQRYKRKVMIGLTGYKWDIQAHEDSYEKFIPDVSFAAHKIDGWIEIKYVDRFPKTLGHIEHYTKGQELWLAKRGRTGSGACFLLVGHPELHVLLHWSKLAKARGAPWEQMCMGADAMWDSIEQVCAGLDAIVRRRAGYRGS